MTKLTLRGFFICVVACAACNGESTAAGTPPDPFIGNWQCSETRSLTFTTPAGVSETKMDTSTLRITASGGVLTASKQSDSGAGCKLSFTSDGSTATMTEGQTCTTAEGISLTYKTGSATVTGSSMSSTFTFDASGNVTINGMVLSAMATGQQDANCSRLSPPPGGGGGATTGGW
jgi:hypothetical protein